LLANPLSAALAVRELLDRGPDEEQRFDGLLLLVQLATDIHVLRRVLVKDDDDS
jgi:hypothetical protein